MFRFNTSAEFWAAGSAEASRGRLNHARGLIEEYVVQCHVERNSSAAIEGYRMLANIAYLQGRMEERMELCRLRLAFWPELSDTTRKHLCKEILASVQQCKNVDTTLQVAVICQRDSSINKLIMPDFQPLLRAVAHECFRKKQWSDVLNILWFQLEHPDYISSSGVEEQLRLLYSTYRQRNEPSVDLAAVRTRESRQPKTSCINMALCCAFMGLGDFSSAIMPFRKVHTVPGFSRLFNEIYLEQLTALTNQFDHERQCRQHVDILWSQMELSAYMAPYAAEDCMRNLFRAYRRINERSLALAAVRARESREPKTSFISMALCCAFMGLGDYNSAMKTFRKVRMVPGFSQLFREIYLEQIGALFEKRAVKASLDMVDFAVKQGVFTYSELHCTLGSIDCYCGTHNLQSCFKVSRDLYRKGYLENLTEFHRKLASLNCGPI